MLQASPSLGLTKFLWYSKPAQSSAAPLTVSASDDTSVVPTKIDATHNDSEKSLSNNDAGQMSPTADAKNTAEGENTTLKTARLREFWSIHMKAAEERWKQYFDQIRLNQQQHDIDTEIGEVDWGAVRERITWRWRQSQEKPENMNSEEWQKLKDMTAKPRPWFIYKNCGLYSRMFYDPESRPIFQEFDFY